MTADGTPSSVSLSRTGVFTGLLAVGLTTLIALTANSLALWADWAATMFDAFAVFIAWRGFKKLESPAAEHFHFGLGRLESFSSLIIGLLMGLSGICILAVCVHRFMLPVAVEGVGVWIGMVLHAIFGGINTHLMIQSRREATRSGSALMSAQHRLYRVKFFGNALMFGCLVLCATIQGPAWVLFADPVAACVIALMLLGNATHIFQHSRRDLLDFALEEPCQLLILRALATHFEDYEDIHDVRTRVGGGKIYVELFLSFDPARSHGEVMRTAEAIRGEITRLIDCHEVLVIPVSAPPPGGVSSPPA